MRNVKSNVEYRIIVRRLTGRIGAITDTVERLLTEITRLKIAAGEIAPDSADA